MASYVLCILFQKKKKQKKKNYYCCCAKYYFYYYSHLEGRCGDEQSMNHSFVRLIH